MGINRQWSWDLGSYCNPQLLATVGGSQQQWWQVTPPFRTPVQAAVSGAFKCYKMLQLSGSAPRAPQSWTVASIEVLRYKVSDTLGS